MEASFLSQSETIFKQKIKKIKLQVKPTSLIKQNSYMKMAERFIKLCLIISTKLLSIKNQIYKRIKIYTKNRINFYFQ